MKRTKGERAVEGKQRKGLKVGLMASGDPAQVSTILQVIRLLPIAKTKLLRLPMANLWAKCILNALDSYKPHSNNRR